jgi:large subunit ribosomal protein L1
MAKHGKRYRNLYAKVDRERDYTPAEAVTLVKSLQSTKATETVEVHIRTGLNVRHAEEQLRGTITLPNSEGRDVTVAVFARGDQARAAEAAGADVVGDEDLAKRVEEGWTDFDVAIATPDMMPVVGRLGRILGPQGKMPNPKIGTVSPDAAQAVSEAKAGKVEYRTDRSAIVHLAIGKTSQDERELLENYAALIDELIRAKPAAAKGRYLRTITLATSQSPGIRVDTTRTRDILEEQLPESAGANGDGGAAEPAGDVDPAGDAEPAA